MTVLRSIAAVVTGYAILVVGSAVIQETVFGGVSYVESSAGTLVAAGLLTPLAAVLGGAATAAIAPSRPLWHLAPMSVLITVETAYLYLSGAVDGPLWFEAGAGLSLIAGAFIGACACLRLRAPLLDSGRDGR